MAKYKVRCVGCSKAVNLTCDNCEHNNFEIKGDELVCLNCNEIVMWTIHSCRKSVTSWGKTVKEGKSALTHWDRNRDNFYVPSGWSLYFVPIIKWSLIIYFLWYWIM